MADREWLRNLANWEQADKNINQATTTGATRSITAQKFTSALQALYIEAAEACEIFNSYTNQKKAIRLLNLQAPDGGQNGIMLLLGRVQLRLQQLDTHLEASLTTFQAFDTHTLLLHRFTPHVDAFDKLTWYMDDKVQVTNELLVQQLLQDIYQATFAIAENEKA